MPRFLGFLILALILISIVVALILYKQYSAANQSEITTETPSHERTNKPPLVTEKPSVVTEGPLFGYGTNNVLIKHIFTFKYVILLQILYSL